MSVLDFTRLMNEAKTATFNVLPDGDYNIIVEESTYLDSQNNKPMIKVKARVTDGPCANQPINTQFVLSEDNAQALSIFFRHMAAFGLPDSWFASLGQNTLEPVAQALNGRRAIFTLGKHEWPKGQTPPSYRNQVNGVKPLTGVPQGGGNGLPGMAPSTGLPGMAPPMATGLPGMPPGGPGMGLPGMPPAPAAAPPQQQFGGVPGGLPTPQPLPTAPPQQPAAQQQFGAPQAAPQFGAPPAAPPQQPQQFAAPPAAPPAQQQFAQPAPPPPPPPTQQQAPAMAPQTAPATPGNGVLPPGWTQEMWDNLVLTNRPLAEQLLAQNAAAAAALAQPVAPEQQQYAAPPAQQQPQYAAAPAQQQYAPPPPPPPQLPV